MAHKKFDILVPADKTIRVKSETDGFKVGADPILIVCAQRDQVHIHECQPAPEGPPPERLTSKIYPVEALDAYGPQASIESLRSSVPVIEAYGTQADITAVNLRTALHKIDADTDAYGTQADITSLLLRVQLVQYTTPKEAYGAQADILSLLLKDQLVKHTQPLDAYGTQANIISLKLE